ncbi:MAG: membrane protein insertase YidC [Coprobacillus sp.]|nr:membrane protein insertase YidC [Coprobacillus sp.]
MKRGSKIGLGCGIALLALVALSSCTQSFCSVKDEANILYAFDYGVTSYYDANEVGDSGIVFLADDEEEGEEETTTSASTTPLELSVTVEDYMGKSYTYTLDNVVYVATYSTNEYLSSLVDSAVEDGVLFPSLSYFETLDNIVLVHAIEHAFYDGVIDEIIESFGGQPYTITAEMIRSEDGILDKYGYLKFADSYNEEQVLWTNWYAYNEEVRQILSYDEMPTIDFLDYYSSTLTSAVGNYRSCITLYDGKFGYYGTGGRAANIEKKTWRYAWSCGFLEGLLVYPISALVDVICQGFEGIGLTIESGVPQILAILIVTIVVRLIIMAISFRPNLSNQKMSALQPELAAIQQKYPNSNTNRRERELMAMEQQKLYKKHHIRPFMSIVVMVIQFPVFLCVWAALQGTAVLSSGTFLGLRLSDTISSAMFTGSSWTAAGGYGAVTALVIFLLMAAAQVMQTLLPQLLQRGRVKKVSKMGKNPGQRSQSNRMRIFQWVMLAIILIMGFFLVSAMAVYWFVGALMGIAQTFLMDYISKREIRRSRYQKNTNNYSKAKVKKR